METKTCPKCSADVPVERWSKGRNCCKACWAAYMREWVNAKPERQARNRDRVHQWQQGHRDQVNAGSRERYAENIEQERQKRREWRARNPDSVRRTALRRYGLTPEQFDAMLAEQRGVCAVCGTDDPGDGKAWRIDHDHRCCPSGRSCGKCVRGLLCHQCNAGIGYLRDDPAVLAAAIDYLARRAA